MKKILSVFLVTFIILSCFSATAFAEETTELKNVNDDALFVTCSNRNIIDIDKAYLYLDGELVEEVYLISMMGSDFSLNPTHIHSLLTCFLSVFSIGNPYLRKVKTMTDEMIPEGSNVILLGHSLGGMIAQQFSASKDMKEKYNILNTVCIGSPFVFESGREGEICRISDSGDIIPFLSLPLFVNAFLGNFEFEANGYFGRPGKAHISSYVTSEKWSEYDCLGIKGGNYTLTVVG